MKRKLVLFLVLSMLFVLLAGCGESEKVINGTVNNANASEKDPKEDVKNEQKVDKEESGEVAAAQDVLKGYVFISGNVKIAMDEEAEAIIEALGEPKSYFEAASCAFEGLDKIYTYGGFEINTYPLEEKDYISSVILKDDTVDTPEGLAIGDSKDKIKELYGAGCTEDDNLIVYEKDDMKLRIILKDENVAAIEYVSNVLE